MTKKVHHCEHSEAIQKNMPMDSTSLDSCLCWNDKVKNKLRKRYNKKILFWLLGTIVLTWLMIILGGVTRLTRSGLSIVEWQPIIGILPPLNLTHWQSLFTKYQQSPEYLQVNYGMTLSEFKAIFWMEYFHRLLGRILGLFYLMDLTYLWIKKYLDNFLKTRGFVILFLLLLQGFVGWYMVKSGLKNHPMVSPYRLTLHLWLALMLGGTCWCTVLHYLGYEWKGNKRLYIMLCMVIITITYGALTAGLKVGLIYNTFPLMGEDLIPQECFFLKPWYVNLFLNPATVQFIHRTMALLSCIIALMFYRFKAGLFLSLSIQILIGICTLLWQVPVWLGVIHQGWAAIIWLILLKMFYVKKTVIPLRVAAL